MSLMPCLYIWELQQDVSYVHQTLKICSDLYEQGCVSKLCHVFPYFCLWNTSETWETGCHLILCTRIGNDAITILENHF